MDTQQTLATGTAQLKAMVAALQVRDGGFTVHPATGEAVTSGYAVSVYPAHGMVLDRVTLGDLLEFMVTRAAVLAWPSTVFGGWCDPEDGRVYLDVSVVTHSRANALDLAAAHDQLAVYDFAAGCSIRTY